MADLALLIGVVLFGLVLIKGTWDATAHTLGCVRQWWQDGDSENRRRWEDCVYSTCLMVFLWGMLLVTILGYIVWRTGLEYLTPPPP
jgi:hypothetical protein